MNFNKVVKDSKIIAIIRDVPKEKILETVQALHMGGIRLMEVTFNQSSPTCTKDTAECIKAISKALGDIVCIGAGTVMNKEQVQAAVVAGAKYIISPNTDRQVIEETKKRGVISIPGAFTPSETVEAYNIGADYVKLFPAGLLGTPYLKALCAPISHIPMMAVGGIGVDNISEFLATGIKGVGVGSSLVDLNMIKHEKWEALTDLAKCFVKQAENN